MDGLSAGVTGRKLAVYSAALLAVAVVSAVFRFLMRRIIVAISRHIEYDLRNDFFARLQILPVSYFQGRRTGDLMSRATSDLNAVRMMVGPAVMYAASTLILFVSAIALMVSIDLRLTLIALIPLPFVSIAVRYFGAAIHARFDTAENMVALIATRIGDAGQGGNLFDDGLEEVRLKVGADLLAHRREALEPHAGVYARFRQRREFARLVAVILHEHQVPDLKIPVAVAPHGTTRLSAGNFFTLVDQDFGAGTAGTGISHGPKIVFFSQPDDSVRLYAGDFLPKLEGLVVVFIDRDPEFVLREFHDRGQELPGKSNSVFFEVVAEGEIPEHLEKRMMPGSMPHVLEVVVFAAGADALLACHRTLVVARFLPQKKPFELHHPRVGEQQRRIVLRHKGRTRHDLMAPFCKIVQKQFS